MQRENRRLIREHFNSQDSKWRIEAVIHDGNWYDINKWKRVARVEQEELEEWIKENEDSLIKSEQSSYRMDYDEIVKWYRKHGLNIEESLVPSNFPPKLWGNTTETDVFLNAPRRRVGTVSFVAKDKELLEKCENILRGVGKIMPDTRGRYKAHGLSATHMKNLLLKGLTEQEYESIDVKTRAVIMQRELADLPPEWLEAALDFYANTFAPTILRSSMATISIYLPDRHDIHSQTIMWVIVAMKKFNENASVPFAGYLSNVLRHWPYDLPDEFLGKELSKFQRDRKRAIDKAIEEGLSHGDSVPIEVIAEIVGIPLKEYITLNNQHENWLAEKNATTLMWEDSSNEKKGVLIGESPTKMSKTSDLYKLSASVVKAAVDSEDWSSAHRVISQIDSENIDVNLGRKLSKEFTEKLQHYLTQMSDE